MDYIGFKCPVCDKNFHADDDVVVCPVCGTPHHRKCYEELGHCYNEDKHSEGYDFEKEENESDVPEGSVKCKNCGEINSEGTFYCSKCGTPLIDIPNNNFGQNQNSNQGNPYGNNDNQQGNPFGNNQNGNPFGNNPNNPSGMPFGAFNAVQYDPMGGVAPETEFEDGAKAGEVAKLVKQNTAYYMQVFNRIKTFNKSKFNFAGLLFGGGYLLYRKQYKLGGFITAIMIACYTFFTYGNYTVISQVLNDIVNTHTNMYPSDIYPMFMSAIEKLDTGDYLIVIFSFVCLLIYYALHLVCGFIANRCYYKHCCKQVKKIKSQSSSETDADNKLQTKGGVNTALAFSLIVVMLILNYAPAFLLR